MSDSLSGLFRRKTRDQRRHGDRGETQQRYYVENVYEGLDAPGGRLWAAWYAGSIREEKFNYMVATTSADDGKIWSDLKLVVDPDGTGSLRASEPKALFPGVMLNKPIVTSTGEWLMPSAIWHRECSRGSSAMRRTDGGGAKRRFALATGPNCGIWDRRNGFDR